MSKILKYNDTNIQFEFGSINMINQNKKRFNIFYKHKSNYESIIIKSPKVKLIYTPDIESKLLTLSLEPIIGNNENLYNFISLLDKSIETYIKQNLKKKVKYRSNITDDNKLFIKLPYKNNKPHFEIYNKHNEHKSINNLTVNNYVICLIEAVDCWIDLNKKLAGVNWNLIQLKYYENICKNICLIDSDDEDEPVIKKEVILLKCAFCNSKAYVSEPFASNYLNHNNSTNTSNHEYNDIGKSINKGKGKGKGPPTRGKGGKGTLIKNNYTQSSSGRGSNTPVKIPVKAVPLVCIPNADELINIRNRLKKI
tara:strand:- start:8827 stop:9756 length:930 start_codon:yes stop_codon:yes gene_type:complete